MIKTTRYTFVILIVLIVLAAVWFQFIPGDTSHHLFLIGYAFCHQNPERSPFAGTNQFTFCYRCTGLYVGILLAALWSFPLRKSINLFSKPLCIYVGLSLLFYLTDSLNASFLLPLFGLRPVYKDQEMIRFLSGFFMGTACSVMILSIFSRLFYLHPAVDKKTEKRNLQLFGFLISGFFVTYILFKGENIFFKKILNFLCSITALSFLSVLYSILILIFSKTENEYRSIWEGKNILLTGLFFCFVQVGLLTLVRFRLTDTWSWFVKSKVPIDLPANKKVLFLSPLGIFFH